MRAASWCWTSRVATYGSTNPWSTRKWRASNRRWQAVCDEGKASGGLRVAAYDPSRPLVIDPVLVYSTYLGAATVIRATASPWTTRAAPT